MSELPVIPKIHREGSFQCVLLGRVVRNAECVTFSAANKRIESACDLKCRQGQHTREGVGEHTVTFLTNRIAGQLAKVPAGVQITIEGVSRTPARDPGIHGLDEIHSTGTADGRGNYSTGPVPHAPMPRKTPAPEAEKTVQLMEIVRTKTPELPKIAEPEAVQMTAPVETKPAPLEQKPPVVEQAPLPVGESAEEPRKLAHPKPVKLPEKTPPVGKVRPATRKIAHPRKERPMPADCSKCGNPLDPRTKVDTCRKCREGNKVKAQSCTGCGCRVRSDSNGAPTSCSKCFAKGTKAAPGAVTSIESRPAKRVPPPPGGCSTRFEAAGVARGLFGRPVAPRHEGGPWPVRGLGSLRVAGGSARGHSVLRDRGEAAGGRAAQADHIPRRSSEGCVRLA